MRPVLAIAMKDLRLLFRDKAGLFFVAAFPLIYGAFFGLIFSGMGGETAKIPLVVADLDQSDASKRLVESLGANKDLEVSSAATREEAVSLVRTGRRAACVVIPPGYGEGGMFTGTPSRLELGVDPARKAEGGMIQGLILQSAFERMQDMFTDPDLMTKQIDKALASVQSDGEMPAGVRGVLQPFLGSVKTLASGLQGAGSDAPEAQAAARQGFQPVVVEAISIEAKQKRSGPSNPFAITFPQAAIWGVMGAAAGFGISLVTERTRGTLMRLRAAPIARWHVLMGKAVACFVTVIGVVLMLLVFARLVFGLRVDSPALFALALACVGVCFVGVMMLLATLGKTEQSAGGVGWAVMVILAMLGGGMIPLFFMPQWMQTVSGVSPIKWAILAMEGAVWRGFTPEQMALPCAVLVGIGIVGFLVGAWRFKTDEA